MGMRCRTGTVGCLRSAESVTRTVPVSVRRARPEDRVAILEQIEVRLDPDSLGFTTGHPSGRGELRGWLAPPSDEGFDSLSLLFAVDAFPPLGQEGQRQTRKRHGNLISRRGLVASCRPTFSGIRPSPRADARAATTRQPR